MEAAGRAEGGGDVQPSLSETLDLFNSYLPALIEFERAQDPFNGAQDP